MFKRLKAIMTGRTTKSVMRPTLTCTTCKSRCPAHLNTDYTLQDIVDNISLNVEVLGREPTYTAEDLQTAMLNTLRKAQEESVKLNNTLNTLTKTGHEELIRLIETLIRR